MDTLSHKLALLDVEPRADKLYLVVAEAVIKKLSNSLAVVKVRKRITQRASWMPTPARNRLGQAEQMAETLDQSQRCRLRY